MSNFDQVKKKQGFASMSKEDRTRIARSGGLEAQKRGTAHRFTSEEAVEAGKLGGAATAAKRKAA